MSKKAIVLGSVLVALAIAGAVGYFFLFGGRSPSRLLGKGFAQVLEVPDMTSVVCVSFDKRGDTTVKDVTYYGKDGYLYTMEFMDMNPFEGTIRWVKSNESESFFQSRALSRVFGTAVNLRLPEDCVRVLNVDVGYAGNDERVKNVAYLATDGKVRAKEYREGFIDRNFEGYLEIRGN